MEEASPTLESIGRRAALRRIGAGVAVLAVAGCATKPQRPKAASNPFQLGVAAGSPAPDGFVLWTRLAPDPLFDDPAAPGGMTGPAVPVQFEIASDSAMRNIVRRGTAMADPAFAYSVHVEVGGLAPARPYWYRFLVGAAASRIGLARTGVQPGLLIDRMRIGFVSCANYEHGYFSAYRHLADEAPDFALFLGDYIYEYVDPKPGTVRRHSDGVEATDLRTYRNRYAQYRLDPDLQRLHAEVPAMVTWDDHEVRNDYADRWSPDFSDPDTFLARRAAAYQAFYEHMPLRAKSRPSGAAMQLYDAFDFGDLAKIALLDGRQYRSREACYGPPDKGGAHLETLRDCPELARPDRSMLGLQQERWLTRTLLGSSASWNVIAQDVMMAHLAQPGADGTPGYWTDDWDGYTPARTRLLRFLEQAQIANPVVLSGDIHAFFANDLRHDFDDPASATVASEFVCTSISAHPAPYETFAKLLPTNPQIRFFESRLRGYAMAEIAPRAMTTQFRAVSDARDPNATVSTLKTFAVEAGHPGPQTA